MSQHNNFMGFSLPACLYYSDDGGLFTFPVAVLK